MKRIRTPVLGECRTAQGTVPEARTQHESGGGLKKERK